jgi:hypothetical protein
VRLQTRIDRVSSVLDRLPAPQPPSEPIGPELARLAQAAQVLLEPKDAVTDPDERTRRLVIARMVGDAALARRDVKPPRWDNMPRHIAEHERRREEDSKAARVEAARRCVLRGADAELWRPLVGDVVDSWTADQTDPSPTEPADAGEEIPVASEPDDAERARRESEEHMQRDDEQRRQMRAVLGSPPRDLLDFSAPKRRRTRWCARRSP